MDRLPVFLLKQSALRLACFRQLDRVSYRPAEADQFVEQWVAAVDCDHLQGFQVFMRALSPYAVGTWWVSA